MVCIECTTHDVSFFKLHRWVEQRNGWQQWKLAPLRKNIYSLRDLRQRMRAANERYLAVMAAIDNRDAGLKDIDKLSSPAKEPGRAFRGSNRLIKKVGHRYTYYLTTFGRRVLTTALKLRETPVVPTLCAHAA